MWFKNLGVYQIKDFNCDDSDLHNRAQGMKFVPCEPHKESAYGWVPPFGVESANFAPSANGVVLLKVQFEVRKVSPSEIQMILDEEIAKLKESDPDIHIDNKMKKNMKANIKDSLQPKAPSSVSAVSGFIDAKTGYIYIDGSPSKCEKFVGALRYLHPEMELDINPIQTQNEPKLLMTEWMLEDSFPEKLSIGNEFSITDQEDGTEITYKKVSGYSDKNLKGYLSEQKRVVKMKVYYGENPSDEESNSNTSLSISDDFQISGISWSDELEEMAFSDYEEIGNASHDEIGTAILSAMSSKSKEVCDYLINECFGGVKTEEHLEKDAEGGL